MDLRGAVRLLESNRPPVLKTDRQLDLSCKQIGDSGAISLFRAFAKNTIITTANLSNCEMAPESAQSIRQALVTNSVLTHLNLSGNDISDEGGLVLLDGLRANSTMRTLELNECGIGEQTILLLQQVVAKTQAWSACNIQSLSLSKNDFSCLTACAFVEGLKGPEVIMKTLNLSHNCLDDSVGVSVGEMLKLNKTLTNLTLNVSDIAQEGLQAIGEGLRVNSTLTALDLRDSEATDRESIEHFFEAILHNTILGTLNLKCHLTPCDDETLDYFMNDRNQRISQARKAVRQQRRMSSAAPMRDEDFDAALATIGTSPTGVGKRYDSAALLAAAIGKSPERGPLPASPTVVTLTNLDSGRRRTLSPRRVPAAINDSFGSAELGALISPRKASFRNAEAAKEGEEPQLKRTMSSSCLAGRPGSARRSKSRERVRFEDFSTSPLRERSKSAPRVAAPPAAAPAIPKSDEIRVFCSFEGQTSSKVVVASRKDRFETFRANVQEKMQALVKMAFYDEDGDEVELDSEDSWKLMARMDVKKFKVVCRRET